MGEHTAAVEAWLGSAGFVEASELAYVMARGGSGSYDRHIAPGLLAPLLKAMQARGRVPAAVRADLLRPPRVTTRTHTHRGRCTR